MSKVKWVDGQAFAEYSAWECFLSGFHTTPYVAEDAALSRDLYLCLPRLRLACARVLAEWPITTAVHISQNRNHQAWMGHAACFLSHRAGAGSSVAAYWMLDERGRADANACVTEAVDLWKSQNAHNLLHANSPPQNGQLAFPFWTPRAPE